MKKKTYELTIDSPCSQKLSEMTPVGHREHFCTLCAKNVVDMRGRSREEVYRAYKSAKGELCTILDPEQLDSPFKITHPNSFLNLARHAIMSVIFFFVTERSHAHRTNKHEGYGYDYVKNFQDNSDNTSNQNFKKRFKPRYKSKKVHKKRSNQLRESIIKIKGTVLDEDSNKPLEYAYIAFIGIKHRYTRSDSSGFFKLLLPKKDRKKLKAIEISFLDKKTRVDIGKKELRRLESGRMLIFDTTDVHKVHGTISYYLPIGPNDIVYPPMKRHVVAGKIRISRTSYFFKKIFHPKRCKVSMDKLKAEDKKD